MSQAAQRIPPERPLRENPRDFWKPQRPVIFRVESCKSCGSELILGARFCHLCGHGREMAAHVPAKSVNPLDWTLLRMRLGLSSASLFAAFFGLACLLIAVSIGMLHHVSGDDVRRLEWLCASLVGFALANLFKTL